MDLNQWFGPVTSVGLVSKGGSLKQELCTISPLGRCEIFVQVLTECWHQNDRGKEERRGVVECCYHKGMALAQGWHAV